MLFLLLFSSSTTKGRASLLGRVTAFHLSRVYRFQLVSEPVRHVAERFDVAGEGHDIEQRFRAQLRAAVVRVALAHQR